MLIVHGKDSTLFQEWVLWFWQRLEHTSEADELRLLTFTAFCVH
jgi:hypothetical protein